jgi:threonine dehydrogenase-like Zn-dependent dehydrogenase
VVLKSTFHGDAPVASSPIVVDEVTIIGSRCGPFSTAIDLLARGAVDVRPLVSGIHPLSEWREAFAAARTNLKVLIDLTS